MVMVICPDCGKEQDNLNKFCRNCGADLSNVEVVEEKVEISPSAEDDSINVPVLNEDGTNSNELVPADTGDLTGKEDEIENTVSENAEKSVDEGVASTESTKKCSSCGAELMPNQKFCPNCGHAVEEVKQTNSMKFCPSCGAELTPNIKFCPNCGLNLNQGTVVSNTTATVGSEKKTPIFSVLLSFLFPGLGQFYNGQSTKGLYFIILAIVAWILTLILIGLVIYLVVWIWSIYDAYKSADAINKGEVLEDKLF